MLGALRRRKKPTLSASEVTGASLRHRFNTFPVIGRLLQAMLLYKFVIGLSLHGRRQAITHGRPYGRHGQRCILSNFCSEYFLI